MLKRIGPISTGSAKPSSPPGPGRHSARARRASITSTTARPAMSASRGTRRTPCSTPRRWAGPATGRQCGSRRSPSRYRPGDLEKRLAGRRGASWRTSKMTTPWRLRCRRKPLSSARPTRSGSTFAQKIPKLKPAAALLWQARARDISGREDGEAYGLPGERGVVMIRRAGRQRSCPGRTQRRRRDTLLQRRGSRLGPRLLALADRAAGTNWSFR